MQRLTISRWRSAALLAVIGLLLIRVQAGEAAEATAKEIVKALQEASKTMQDLGGAMILEGKPDKEQLQLQGFVTGEEQAAAVLKQAEKLMAEKPAWKKVFPKGVSAAGLQPLCAELQRLFAENQRANRPERDLLRQARLDAVAYDKANNTLIFQGECIYLGTPAPELRSGAPAPAPPGGAAVPPVPFLDRAIREHAAIKQFNMEVNVEKVVVLTGTNNPLLALQQKLTEGLKLDEVLVTARYDRDGVLQLEGVVGSEDYLKRIDEFFEGKSGPVRGLRPKGMPKNPRWSRAQVRAVKWPLSLTKVQAMMAADSELLVRQTRLDRVFFAYSPTGQVQLRYEGICCSPDFPKEAGKLTGRFRKEENRLWPELETHIQSLPDLSAILPVGQPDSSGLPEQIAESKTLDGVRLDGGAYFDAEGALCLQGLWLGLPQAKELTALAHKVLKDKKSNSLARGLSLKDLKPSRTNELLGRLRQWTAENREDCWLERLLFRGPHLELRGTVLSADAKEVEKQFVRMHKGHAAPLSPPRVAFKEVPAGFSERIRAQLATGGTQGDGILLDRCYYDQEGEFLISGLLDNAKQKALVDTVLEQMVSQGQWSSSSGKGWTAKDLRVVELQPMLTRLLRVLPAYSALDGVQLDRRAYHNDRKQLVLTCRVIGQKPNQVAEKQVQDLLLAHPVWKARAAAGVVLETLKRQDADRVRAAGAIMQAMRHVREGDRESCAHQLLVARLHNPEDSTAWFLSAYCHLALGEQLLAERDLRRVATHEKDARGGQSITRRRRLEWMQGAERQRLEELLMKVTVDMAKGKPPLSLNDEPE